MLDGAGHQVRSFDKTLRDALADRAARDLIQKVHLRSQDEDLLASILSSLTPEEEGIRPSRMESIVLGDVDASNFFARHRFPKLRDLSLSMRSNITWDHLKSHARTLVNLVLRDDLTSPAAAPQILSLLASSPGIRTLKLLLMTPNNDSSHGLNYRVSLPHLESFSLIGSIHQILSILQRLEFPSMVNDASLIFFDSTLEESRQVIGPCIQDYLKRDARFGDGLKISVSSTVDRVSIRAGAKGFKNSHLDRFPNYGFLSADFAVVLSPTASERERYQLCIDMLALLPRERVVYLETNLSTGFSFVEELFIPMHHCALLVRWCFMGSYCQTQRGQTQTRNSYPLCGGCI